MNTLDRQREKAIAFRAMHSGPRILVLPNAWDAISALIFAKAGFQAIATTSAGVASVLGYSDGEVISKEEMLHLVGRIAATVDVPVTADFESAYAETPEQMAETVREAIEAGVVGVNVEDTKARASSLEKRLMEIEFQVDVIKALRAMAEQTGIPLVINARTDTYLYGAGDAASRFRETVRRANAYREAGADCVFPIAVKDRDTIAQLAREIRGPLNILAGPGLPPVPELQELGVARVTFGSNLMRGTFPLIRRMAEELRDSGTYNSFNQTEFTHPVVNEMLRQ